MVKVMLAEHILRMETGPVMGTIAEEAEEEQATEAPEVMVLAGPVWEELNTVAG